MSAEETRWRRASPSDGKREPRCPKCASRTGLTPNPYYGAGLAVHPYLRVCRRCPWAGIVRESPILLTAPIALPQEAEEQMTEPPRRRLKRRRA
jgi:hypothetical protein